MNSLHPQKMPGAGRDDQTRRVARVLDIIQQIAVAPGGWSRRRLAEHHEVSERMVTKDLELIRIRLGLPLEHDGTAYRFERLPHLPTAAYSFPEALALVSAARAAQAVPGVNSAELAAAIARLESIFPPELVPLLREATDRLPRKAVKEHRQGMLNVLHRAMVERHQLKIVYATSSRRAELNERVVEPYALLPYGRSWHLIAYDHLRENVLQFKVDRVQTAESLDVTYQIPADFDLDRYLGDAWGVMRGAAGEAEEVSLLFEPQAGRWVSEENWHSSQTFKILADDSVRVHFRVGITPEMVRWLMSYGWRVKIEAPQHLADQVAAEHRAACDSANAEKDR